MALYRGLPGREEGTDDPEKIVRRVQEVSAVLYHLEQVREWGKSLGFWAEPGVRLWLCGRGLGETWSLWAGLGLALELWAGKPEPSSRLCGRNQRSSGSGALSLREWPWVGLGVGARPKGRH